LSNILGDNKNFCNQFSKKLRVKFYPFATWVCSHFSVKYSEIFTIEVCIKVVEDVLMLQ